MILLTVFALGGCTIYDDVYAVTEPDIDLSGYHSFAWLPDQTQANKLPFNNEVVRNNIRNYFGKSFSERGYVFEQEKPDLLLRLSIENKLRENSLAGHKRPYYYHRYYYGSRYYQPYPCDYYYRHHGQYLPPGTNEEIGYLTGTFTLDVFDRAQNKLVWSGKARIDVFDPAFIDASIHPAIIAIMKKYPVKPVSTRGRSGTETSPDK